jgi:HSP20 family protein
VARKRDIERLRDEVDELFADLWQLPRFTGARHGFRPPVDCFRSPKLAQLVVVVELAGIDPEHLSLTVDGRELVVAGERKRDREEGRVYQLMELEDGPFERRIPLAPDVDVRGANARYDRGLLTVVFPLTKPHARSGKLLIQVRTR